MKKKAQIITFFVALVGAVSIISVGIYMGVQADNEKNAKIEQLQKLLDQGCDCGFCIKENNNLKEQLKKCGKEQP